MSRPRLLTLAIFASLFAASCGSDATAASGAAQELHDDRGHPGAVLSEEAPDANPSFDLLQTSVSADDDDFVFRSQVVDSAGTEIPEAVGTLDQAPVWSYVWPTSLDSDAVGFDAGQGILALAATAHPDFDDTPLYDENGDGDLTNDGADWHAHWVVLVEDETCGGGLSVKDIPEGETPTLPPTWPELPILIDSPDLAPLIGSDAIEVRVPKTDIGAPDDFSFDGVTSGLRVSTTPHNPLLCVEAVFDIASGDLSLPGKVDQ